MCCFPSFRCGTALHYALQTCRLVLTCPHLASTRVCTPARSAKSSHSLPSSSQPAPADPTCPYCSHSSTTTGVIGVLGVNAFHLTEAGRTSCHPYSCKRLVDQVWCSYPVQGFSTAFSHTCRTRHSLINHYQTVYIDRSATAHCNQPAANLELGPLIAPLSRTIIPLTRSTRTIPPLPRLVHLDANLLG